MVSTRDMLLRSEIVGFSKVDDTTSTQPYQLDFIMKGNAKKVIKYANEAERDEWYKYLGRELSDTNKSVGFGG